MAEGIDPVSLEEQRKQAVDRLFTEEVADEDQRKAFRQQSWDLTQPPPDQAGEALQLGNKFGVPRKAVEADPEYWKRRDQEARRKLLMEASPRTMAWLDDEDNYAVAKDDVDILSQIESTFSKIGYAAKGGFQRFAAVGVANERQAMGETMEFYRQRDEWEAREERRKKLGQDAPRGWRTVRVPDVGTIRGFDVPISYGNLDAAPAASGIVREEVRKALPESMRPMFASQVGIDDAKAVRGVLERRMDMVDARARAKVEEFTETLEKAQTGNYVADGLLSGVTSLTEMAPSMAAFFALRGRGGATVASGAMGVQVAGAEYLEGIYNLNLSERDASDRALLQAGVEVVTERISLGYLDDLMKSDRGFVSKLAISMGQEQFQEQFATLGNRLVDIPYVDQDMTVQRFIEETPYYAGKTALATLVASGITNTTLIGLDTAVRDMVERSVLSQPSAGDAAIDAVLKKAKESRLGKRSPEKMKDVLDRQAAGTGVETVTVDLDELAQALKEKGVELSDALDGLGVPRDVLQQKWENFGEIEVKLSDLATSDLMRLYGAETQAHTRRNDDPYTPARKEKMREALEPEMQETAKRIYDDLQNGADMAEKEQQVAERVRSRIRGAGILAEREQENASVAIQTAMVTTLARRVGADPVEFYDQHYPRIQGSIDGMVAEEGALEQRFENILTYLDPQERGTEAFSDERLTASQNKAVEMRRNGYTNKEVADEMDIDEANVRVLLSKAKARAGGDAGLFPEVRQPPERAVEVLRLMREGLEIAQISERLGVSDATVTSTAAMARKAVKASGQAVPDWLEKRIGAREDALSMEEEDALAQLIGPATTGDLLAQEITMPDLENKDEVEAALNDPETDVLPLTEGMQILELDEFIAFHGTTAKFDQFKSDKIGAGEGAQAFGPGHYFTQSAGVAEWYRKRMKKLSPGIKLGKESFNKANPVHYALAQYWQMRDPRGYHEIFGGYLGYAREMSHADAIRRTIGNLELVRDSLYIPAWRESMSRVSAKAPVILDSRVLAEFLDAAIEHLKSMDPDNKKGVPKLSKPTIRGGGNIYTVAIKLPRDATIQLDETFGRQPERVQQAFREAAEAGKLGEAGDLIAKYGAGTRMGPLVAALKKSDTPAMEIMRRNGVRGVRYLDGMSRGKRNPANQTFNYVVFNDGDVKILDRKGLLFQELDQQRRGQFSPSQNIITMFEAADVTTLMHEGAHWYLAEIERMASAEGAHPFVTEQWEAVKKWGKVGPDFRMYDDMGRVTEEGRELQEAFAETFEVYLQTGKAPVPSLREAFRAFKQWITALWRDIRTGKIRLPERANLSPEITRVMDRMLAVDEEIESQTAEVVTKAEAMANDLYERGIITKRQRDAAIMNLDEAREAAKEDLMAHIMQAELRVREAQLSAEQRRIKGDVTREYDRSAVGRAVSWLGYGQWKGDVPVSETEGRDSEVEFYQSIRTATRMPMEDIYAWVVENVDSKIQQFSSGDEGTMMSWRLSDAPDAPRVLLSIRLNRKGRADVNLFLNNKMADALDEISDPVERSRIATEMFSQAIMVMRQYSAETPDLKAFNFIAAENEKAGRKAKSREELYRFLLSTMRMDGYTAYEIGSQTSVVRQTDGVKSADPLFDGAGFVMIRDGVDVDEFARNEILRGSQSGGDAGEVVTALTAVRLSRAPRGGVDRGRLEAGRADPRSAVDDTLGQSLPGFYSALGRFIASSNTARAPAAQWKGMIQNAPGVKAEEVEWTGVLDWLDASEGPVTRDVLAAFVEANGVTVEEVVRGGVGVAAEAQQRMLPLIEERDRVSRDFSNLFNRVDVQNMTPEETTEYNQIQARLTELNDEIRNLQRTIDLVDDDAFNDTKWSSWTLPGGENYREMLLTLPRSATQNDERLAEINRQMDAYDMSQGMEGFNRLAAERDRLRDDRPDYRSSHWSEPNVLAHVRFKERTGPNGERVLALEEVQSDWHQAGRERGYISPEAKAAFEAYSKELAAKYDLSPGQNLAMFATMKGMEPEEVTRYRELQAAAVGSVPNAPFKNNAWANLVLKRMIRYAAENGFDAVAWIPGNVQNGQIVEDTGDNRGDFYDKIVPNLASKLGKKYGAKVTKTPMDMPAQARGTGWEDTGQPRAQIDAGAMSWWTLPITPELAAAAMTEGFPLFQRGDPKGWGETAPPPDLPPMRLDLEAVRELYGEDAVRRLPKPIRDRSRDKTSIDGMMDVIRASAKTLKRKPPPTLFQYIRSRKARTVAGQTVPIKKWGIKGAADELKAMNREDLINETNGIHIDYVRESAAEAGYLPEDATVNDFLNAIDREARGEPVYSRFDQKEIEDQRFAKEWADWLDSQGIDIFETDMKKLKAQVAKVVTSTAADAVTPDQAAEMLGFPTGEDLLNVLSMMGNRDQWVKEETDRRLREEFGDPMADGTFEEEARIIAEAEVMSRAAEIEMEALARAVGEPAASKLAKEMAMDSLGLMTVKELKGWERFLNAERREMNNTLEAVKRGDMVQAFIHKRRQLVNMHLARAAREKSQAIEKTRKDLLTYYSSKGRRDKIAPDYLEKIEALLEGYELRVSKQGPGEQKRRMSAKEYVDQMIADGREAEIAPEAMMLAEMAGNKVWRGLTADEVDYLAGTVRNLAHLGRTKGRLMREQEKRRFDAVVAELVDTLMAAPSSRPRGKSFSPGAVEEVTTRASQFDAKLTKIQDELELLDGREAGPLQTTLLLPMEQADVRKGTMMRGAIKEIRRLWNDVPAQLRRQTLSRRVATPELKLPTNENMTLMDVVIIGLNWGNAGNRQALIDGYGWDPASVETVLDRYLTNEHWQFIEGVWNLIGSYKADAFALEKRITGVEPKAVEGITFTLPSGRVVKGQYYPLKYDADQESALSVKQQKLDEKQMLSEMGLSFSKPMTKTGHLISRVGSGGKPVKVSIDVFYEHVENVVHDIAFRPAVIDAFKIIRDPRFTQAYIDAAGKAQYDRLLPWLHSIATNNRARFSSTFARTMTFFRGSWSIAIMGYSFSTATQQLTGYLEAGTEIGGRWVMQGALKSLSMGPASFWREWAFIRDRSEYLSNRVAFGKERDIRAVRTRATIGGPLTPIGDNAFVFLSVMDAIVGTAVWRGAYDKAMAGKVNGIAKGEEDAAIAYADRAVQRSLSSGETYALPEIMREGEISALMTMVYSYGSKTYNRQRVRNMKLRQGRIGVAEFTINTLIAFTAVPILAALLAGRLWPDDEEEWEDRGDDVGNEILMNAAGTTPFVRDMITLLAKPQYGYQLSPVQSTFEQIGVATRSAAEGKTFDNEYQTKQAVMAISTIFRLPGGQLFETGDYVYDLYMGDEDPLEDPADAAREAFIRSER